MSWNSAFSRMPRLSRVKLAHLMRQASSHALSQLWEISNLVSRLDEDGERPVTWKQTKKMLRDLDV